MYAYMYAHMGVHMGVHVGILCMRVRRVWMYSCVYMCVIVRCSSFSFNPSIAKRLSAALSDNVAIQVLEGSPIVVRRNVEQDQDPSNHSNEVNIPITPDGTWPRMASPRRRNEKSVFKMLKESDPNYTIRRQKLQMSLLLEKNQLVKTVHIWYAANFCSFACPSYKYIGSQLFMS